MVYLLQSRHRPETPHHPPPGPRLRHHLLLQDRVPFPEHIEMLLDGRRDLKPDIETWD